MSRFSSRLAFSLMLAAAAVAISLAGADAADLYVAPDGNDANPGTKDQPFASLERARDAAREAKAAGAVTVHVRGGRYELARPLEFTAADSGTKEQPVTWLASEDEKPVVSGGTVVTGWRRHDDTLWAADVPWVRERGRPFYQLFVNGQRRVRARMPNEGSYFYTRRLQVNNAANNQLCFGMTYRDSDLAPLHDTAGATVVLFHNWVNSFNRIGQMDRDRHRIEFARPAGVHFLSREARYYVEGVREALDAPGEWHLDADQGTLYYHPLPGEEMERARIGRPMALRQASAVRGGS